MSNERTPLRLLAWSLRVGVLPFSIGILSVAYMGSFMRLSGDDYCYGAVLREEGFVGAQIYSYTGAPPYHGDRYSLTLVSGLASVAGPWASAALPALVLAAWTGAIAWCGWRLAREARIPHPAPAALYAATAIVFLTVYQAPDRVESVYWRSASIPYMVPLLFIWVIFALILAQTTASTRRPGMLVSIFALGFFAAGFSEVAAAVQVGWLLTAGALAVLAPVPAPPRRLFLRATAAGLAGAVLGLLVMALSPFTMRTLDPAEGLTSLTPVASQALRAGASFLRETAEGLPAPTVLTLVLGAALGVALGSRGGPRHARRWWPAIVVGLGFLLVATPALTMAPSILANGYLPNPRALLPARHLMVVGFAALGAVLGVLLAQGIGTEGPRIRALLLLSVLAIAVLSVYPLTAVPKITLEAEAYRDWAESWDVRDALIRAAGREGVRSVAVPWIGSLIPGVAELSTDPGYWYNLCAAGYYGVEAIFVAEG